MVTYNLYYSSNTNEKIIIPKKSNIPEGFTKVKETSFLTGELFKDRGKPFWKNHILHNKLDVCNMTYDRVINCKNNEDKENLSKLLDKNDVKLVWSIIKDSKDKKKMFESFIGKINLELYIILLKLYRNDMNIDEYLCNTNKLTITEKEKKEVTMIDLFAGTGAFSKVFEENNIKCRFANDFCKNSKKIFDMNHDIDLTYGDLNDIKNEDIPTHTILCGGFPCQPFSIAGKQQGFEDERSNVFWKIINIIKYHNPEIVILENVKNLKSHDKGDTFKVINKKLSDLGYHIKYNILNTSKITEVPQNRERIYIVCFKDKNKYDKFDFDFEEKEKKQIKELLTIEDIPDKYYYTDRFKVYDSIKEGVTKKIDENVLYQYRRYYVRENKNNVCPTLTANMGGGGHNVPLLKDKKGIRRLTPRECFNLQGFPIDYKLPDVCDSALYKLAGNAVSIPVVRLISEKISKLFV